MGSTVIIGGLALIGAELTPLVDAVVVLSDGAVAAAGRRGEVAPPRGSDLIDATGMTIVPGFIDAHVHIGLADPLDIARGGVTTVRDLAWPPSEIWPLVERSRSPDFPGPTIAAAGQMLTVDGGYPTRAAWAPPGTGRVVASPHEASAAVAEQADAGATVIKVALNPVVGPSLDLATLTAIVEAAHGRSLEVTGHTYGRDELDKALAAGMDELAHMLMSPERIPSPTLQRMVEAGMRLVPTLSCFFGEAQEIGIDNLRRFAEAGGSIVYGTDLGNEGPQPGIDRREIDALTRAGMSPLAIIRSATAGSAESLGLPTKGELSAGRDADVVALRGDATTDVDALTEVAMVWRMGRRLL